MGVVVFINKKNSHREFPGSPVWLGLHTFTAKGSGSIPDYGTRIPRAAKTWQKKKKVYN